MFDELLSSLTVDQLKPRLALLDTQERPTRKADIIALLRRHLLSPQLRDYWEKLDAGLVRLLTSDPATRDHCLQAGAKLLVVPEKAEKGLRDGLRKLGYIFPAG
jgi:hypothetical protein